MQEVNVFENIEALDPEVRDELSLVTAEEYVEFDKDVQCYESVGSTPDEIASLVIAESLDHQAGTSSAPDDEDLQDSDTDELETVDTNRFQFLTKRDVKDALSAL